MSMLTEHDEVISVGEFWRVLALVVVGFGIVLALSWTIDAVVSHQIAGTAHALSSHA
jgi:hypothetical protein